MAYLVFFGASRAAHSIDTTLHSLSDTQLVASIGLLFAMLYQSCDISAYHYNLVSTCFHVYGHTCIRFRQHSSLFQKNFWSALVQLFGILPTFVFTWFLCKNRDVQGFPIDVASLTILPAFNGSNSILDPSFFSTRNISAALLPTLQHTASTSQFWHS